MHAGKERRYVNEAAAAVAQFYEAQAAYNAKRQTSGLH